MCNKKENNHPYGCETGEALVNASVLAVVSGGMDSITMLYANANAIGKVVSFNYGSKHNAKEIEKATLHCKRLNIPHIIIDMSNVFTQFKSDLLLSGGDIPEGHYEDETMKKTVVPFRNGIMLSVAAGLAESHGLAGLMIASHAGDHAVYPDCRPHFNRHMRSAIKHGTDKKVTMFFPYADKTKRDIAEIGHQLELNYNETWSCYKGGDIHCGKCSTCVERIWALKDIPDNTDYEDADYAIALLQERGEW